ncbi:conserved hypothetical protein [Sporisorium reilianum SRZ2]|uniref:Uncharacterized protein n=1 Tax=Sporisorium reilianum (strain SRZ2) TaxID=999809 RepID=E6ZPB8_SPORE|nr:conserved hypothetical protein [Sporisorium reilianum SRZ2]
MPFSPKAHTALFAPSRRRTSLAHGEESEILASGSTLPPHHSGMQPSASTSWISPFGRASFSVDDDSAYVAPGSQPGSRRPSAATIISTLLHGVGVGKEGSAVRLSQDGYTSGSEEALSSSNGSSSRAVVEHKAAQAAHGRRPSAIFKAWKAKRGSQSTQGSAPQPSGTVAPASPSSAATPAFSTGFAPGRRKSSALTRVLQPSALRNNNSTTPRVDEHHSLASSDSAATANDSRRRSLSIVCRGERESDELERASVDPGYASGGKVTAAMAIRDTWLYGEHQWTADGSKGSVSTLATSPTQSNPPLSAMGRKSFSVAATTALGLDEEERHIQKQRMRERRFLGSHASSSDAASVVSLSLTEEIALYTSDVQAVEHSTSRARTTTNSTSVAPARRNTAATLTSSNSAAAAGAFVWNLPDWTSKPRGSNAGVAPRLPELTLASRQREGADEAGESAGMQRVESGSLDPVLSPVPAYSPSLPAAAGVQWAQPQWNAASPFRPDAPAQPATHRASFATSYWDAEDQSPTAPNFPPAAADDESRRRATTYYDASALPIVQEMPSSPTPASHVRSFGHTAFHEMHSVQRRTSYSHPRPPPRYEPASPPAPQLAEYDFDDDEHVPTPRLVGLELGEPSASPLSSNFAPDTPASVVATFGGQGKREDEGEDLHAQFCSVLLLDLGDGTAIPLSPSPGAEPRPDPFALLAY